MTTLGASIHYRTLQQLREEDPDLNLTIDWIPERLCYLVVARSFSTYRDDRRIVSTYVDGFDKSELTEAVKLVVQAFYRDRAVEHPKYSLATDMKV